MIPYLTAESLEDAKFLVIGVPLKLGSEILNNNYALGPKLFREASEEVFEPLTHNKELRGIDWGDINLKHKSLAEDLDTIYNEFLELIKFEKPLVSIGGNHLITYPIIKAISSKHSKINLIFVDSHLDAEDKELDYSSFVRYLVEENYVNEVLFLGYNNISKSEKKFLEENKERVYGFSSLQIKENLREVRQFLEDFTSTNATIYLSIDLDAFYGDFAHWYEPFAIEPLDFLILSKGMRKVNYLDLTEIKTYKGAKLANRLLVEVSEKFT